LGGEVEEEIGKRVERRQRRDAECAEIPERRAGEKSRREEPERRAGEKSRREEPERREALEE
jgi:hypothetical protein